MVVRKKGTGDGSSGRPQSPFTGCQSCISALKCVVNLLNHYLLDLDTAVLQHLFHHCNTLARLADT